MKKSKPKTNTNKSRELRQRRTNAGEKEMRGIWLTSDEEKIVKPMVKAALKGMRNDE